MSNSRRILSLAALAAVIGVTATCSDEFPFAPEESQVVLFQVRIEQANAWPDEIRLGETVTLEVRVVDRNTGQEIASAPGMEVSWRVDAGNVLDLAESTGLTNDARGLSVGSATPTVTVSGGPVEDATYSAHTFTVAVAGVVLQSPGDTTVDALGDTLTFVAKGLDVDGNAVDDTGMEWRLSASASAVTLVEEQGDTVRVAVTGEGADTVYASHPQCVPATGQSCEQAALVTVSPVPVAMAAAQDTFDIDALGGSVTVAAEFTDRNGFPVSGPAVTWSLVDPADTAVVELDTSTGVATAVSAGVADVALTSSIGDDTATVKVFQIVTATGLDTTSFTLEGIGATDSLFLAPTDANGNALERTPAVSWSSTTGNVAVEPNLTDSTRAEITVVSFGDAYIIADVEGVRDSVEVTATGVVASVTVSPSEVTITQLSNRPTLSAAAYDSLGNQIPNAPLSWASTDEAVATVEPDPDDPTQATVTPVSNGTAYVTATSGSFADSALVTVDIITTFTCDDAGTVYDAGGGTYFVSSSETWTKEDSPHHIRNGYLTVDSAVVLTVEPGALVCVEWGGIEAQGGARIMAQGTADDRILFTATNAADGDRWEFLRFTGAPGDTSRLEHVVVQNLWNAVASWDEHPLVIQNALISQSAEGVHLYAPGSRLSDSRVEGIDGKGVELASHTRVENTTISGTGWSALSAHSWQDSVSIVNVTVENGGTAQVGAVADVPAAVSLQDARFLDVTPVTVTDSRLPFDGSIDAFVRMYPTTADMDVLVGNINDAVQLRCGWIDPDDTNDPGDPSTVTFRGDFEWRVICGFVFHGTSTLQIEPGATVKFVTDGNHTGWESRDIEFYGEARLVAQGTETDPITFTSLEPGGEWYRLYMEGPHQAAADTSFFKHVLVENAWEGIYQNAGAHVVVDSSRIRNTGNHALTLNTNNDGVARVTSTVIDTVRTNQNDGRAAVNIWSNTLLEDVTVRGAAGMGIKHHDIPNGDGPRLRNVTIEGAQSYGLHAYGDSLVEATNVTVTGGGSYPAALTVRNLYLLAPTAAEQQARLAGNAKDTLEMHAGWTEGRSIKGEVDVFGNIVSLDTLVVAAALPWRVISHPRVDTAAVLLLEPGAHMAFEQGAGIEFYSGRLISDATSAEPAVLTAVDPSNPWGELRFQGTPKDTSYLRNAVLEYGGDINTWPYVNVVTMNAHPLVIDSTTFRQVNGRAVELKTSGSRITASVVDTTLTNEWPAAVWLGADSTSADGLTVRGAANNSGIFVDVDSVSLANVRVEGALYPNGYGIEAQNGTFSAAANVRVTGGAGYPAYLSIENLQLIEQDSLLGNAKDTLWVSGGSAQGETDVFGTPTAVDTLVARAGVPWRVTGYVTFDTASVFMPEPGAVVTINHNGGFQFREGQLVAVGTETDSITFSAANPLEPWQGLEFHGTAPDTSRLEYVNVNFAASDCCWPHASINARDQHPLVIENSRVWRSQNRAIDLTARGSRIRNVVVDTTFGTSGNYNTAVELGTGTRADTLVIRRTAGGTDIHPSGLRIKGDSVQLSAVRIEEAQGVGLWVNNDHYLPPVSGLRVTGSLTYPARLQLPHLFAIAPTAADQDSLLGNGRDTLVVNGGTLRGEVDAFGNPVTVDTATVRADLPWRIQGSPNVDSAAVLEVEPGATIAFEGGHALVVTNGQLLAQGTSADSIRFIAANPTNRWAGLRFSDTAMDTSRVSYAVISDAGTTGWWPYTGVYTTDQHPAVLEDVTFKRMEARAAELRASGTRFTRVVVDTAVSPTTGGFHAAMATHDSITLEDVTIRGSGNVGLNVVGDSVMLNGVRIEGSIGDGLRVEDQGSFTDVTGLRITGGHRRPGQVAIHAVKWLEPDSLLGNAADTVAIIPSSLINDSIQFTSGIPWTVTQNAQVNIETGGVVQIDPGTVFGMEEGAYIRGNNGVFRSLGTESDPVRFLSQSGQVWRGLEFYGTPDDTIRIRNTRISYAGTTAAIESHDGAVVVVDSTLIRQSGQQAIYFQAPGSQLNYSVIDTTNNASWAAVELISQATINGSRIRGAAGDAVQISSDNVVVDSTEITLSGSRGIVNNATASSQIISNNNFVDNSGVAVDNNDTGTSLDASDNWWGADAEPPLDGANGYSGDVIVSPWLTAAIVLNVLDWYTPGG